MPKGQKKPHTKKSRRAKKQTTPPDPVTDQEVRATIIGYADEDEREVAGLGAELRAGKRTVFFYPASGFDWQPLHRFSHRCGCFVYIDPRATREKWREEVRALEQDATKAGANLKNAQLLASEYAYRVLAKAVGPLAEMQNEPWARVPNLQNRPAWGAVQKLKRIVGGKNRTVWLIFLAGSPLLAYQRLFIETGTAPAVLSIHSPRFDEPAAARPADAGQPAVQQQWAAYAGWNGELGGLLRQHDAPSPELLVADIETGWPTYSRHYAIPGWRSAWKSCVYTATEWTWPKLSPSKERGSRRVVVTRNPINPFTSRKVEAVVVTNEKFRQYRWPDGVLVILSGPPVFPENAVPDGPNVVNIDIATTPLLQALAKVEAVCAERGITKVAVQGVPGFEDEADDLTLWRQQDGQIKQLTIHCESDGHFIDFAPAADQIR
jgi:hypothetical protein